MAPTKIHKVERLTNLFIALLSTRRFLSAEKIRENVAGYRECQTDEAFSRMFERDKNELRELGIPIQTGRNSSFDSVDGYRIKPEDYALPDIDLTPEESTAVGVATTLWESPDRITATQTALLKLRAAGVDVDPVTEVAITTGAGPRGLRGSEAALGVVFSAIESGRAVQFEHRPNPVGPSTVRTVEPWGVVTANGRWYLVGHDRDRAATRVFRLSRIGADVKAIGPQGDVDPPDEDLRALVQQSIETAAGGGQATGPATVWVADGCAVALRRVGHPVGRRTIGGRQGDVLTLEVGSPDGLAREVAGYGADALILDPPSLRADVLARLTAQAQS